MSRTKGAIDLNKRKERSDKIRKYVHRKGKLILYKPKRKKQDPLRIWFWERTPMSFEGYMRFPPHLRAKLTKNVTRFVGKPLDVSPDDLASREKIGMVAIDVIQYPGAFLLMMPTHSKNSYHVSYKKKAHIKITETEEGLRAIVRPMPSLSRYWFFRGSR